MKNKGLMYLLLAGGVFLLLSMKKTKGYKIEVPEPQKITKEEFEKQKRQFSYENRQGYERCKNLFRTMMQEKAWHKSQYLDFSENSSGNYALQLKNGANVFFGNGIEDGENLVRL